MVFLTAKRRMPEYMIYPRFLLNTDLTETERLVYVVLLDRARLSMQNEGWADGEGRVYLLYPIGELAQAIGKSAMTVKRALKSLERRGLIARKHIGLTRANHIFVKLPDAEGGAEEGTRMIPLKEQKCSARRDQKCSVRREHRCSTINNYPERTTEQEPKSKETPAAYGPYGNVYLTGEDVARLKGSVPDYQGYIERLSSYMASTGKTYRDHAAAIQSWALRDRPAKKERSYDCKEGESL